MSTDKAKPRDALPPTREYTFRKASEGRHFIQPPLMDADEFARSGRDRGIGFSTSHDDLEQLDEAGALRPIAFSMGPYSDSPYLPGEPVDLPEADLRFRDESAFVPWKEFSRQISPNIRGVTALYSHWQLLYAHQAVDEVGFKVSLPTLLDEQRMERAKTIMPELIEGARSWWQNLDDAWRQTLLLLIRIQNRYFPLVQGSTTLLRTQAGDLVSALEFEEDRFDPQKVLAELGLEASDVRQTYVNLSRRASSRDPVVHLYLLVRMMPFEERERLRREPRRAHDFYDACEMLRYFYFDLTGTLLPDADEDIEAPGKWRENLLGHERRLTYSRKDLETVLKRHRLYPHGIHLLVEGETEELLFPLLFDGMFGESWRQAGVRVSNVHGVDNLPASQELLVAARQYAQAVVLVLDREGDAARQSQIWIKRGLLVSEHVFLWGRSLEQDNFQIEELISMISVFAAERGCRLGLDAETVRSKYEAHVAKTVKKNRRGLGTFTLGLARQPKYGSVVMGKTDLVRNMASVLLDEMRDSNDWHTSTKRPMYSLLATVSLLFQHL